MAAAIQALKKKHAAAIAHKDAMIRDKDAHIAALSAHIGNLDALVAHERHSIQCHAQATAQRDAEIVSLRMQIAELTSQLKAHAEKIAELNGAVKDYMAAARSTKTAHDDLRAAQAEMADIVGLLHTALAEQR